MTTPASCRLLFARAPGHARRLALIVALVAGLCAVDGRIARADGGKLQASEHVGPWIVSLFTSPATATAGPVDISVFVQRADTKETVTDATIQIVARAANSGFTVRQTATRDAATNKLFQAAWMDLPTPGRWSVTAEVSREETLVETSFEFWVSAAPPAWSDLALWIVWPCVPIGLYATAQIRSRRQRWTR